jgi:hypothetical protein
LKRFLIKAFFTTWKLKEQHYNFNNMKSFFEGIQYLFVDILFTPLNFFRSELESWFAANTINGSSWLFVQQWYTGFAIEITMTTAKNQDTTAHSFLNKSQR